MPRICLHINDKEIRVLASDVEHYLQQGYIMGKPARTEEHKRAISRALTGLKNSDETKAKKSKAKLGKTWQVINGKRVWMERSLARELAKED